MARIQGVAQGDAGLTVKLAYWYMRRAMRQMTGSEPRRGSGIEPIELWAHQPKMLSGMGKMEGAVRKGKSIDERLKHLIEAKGAAMIGCEYCLDLGSAICRNSGLADEELLDLLRYRESTRFSEREKTALDYTVAVMRTPVEVDDELFARMREHFSDEQLVEITALLTLVNHHRFNAAFDIGSAGFSAGGVCVVPEVSSAV
jgi:alkylhydroperoxidase family enzyme